MTDVMNKKEVNDRLKLFFDSKTYTYLKNVYGTFFNGYIISIEEKKILFKDDVLGKIPIDKAEIIKIDYSTKNKEAKND